MARIAWDSSTSSSITVYLDELDTSYSGNDRIVKWYIDGSYDGQDTLPAKVSKSDTWKFTGLDANTDYEIKAIVTFQTSSVTIGPRTIGTEEEEEPEIPKEDEISLFNWGISIYSGRKVSDVSYSKWNSLINKIEELLDTGHYGSWRTSSANGATLSASGAKMDSSDKVLTAERFNSVRYNIDYYSPTSTGISKVSRGYPVLAEYFDSLEEAINDWIDEYNYDYA